MVKAIFTTAIVLVVAAVSIVGMVIIHNDTVFTATINDVAVIAGQPASPEDFIAFYSGRDNITIQFANENAINWFELGQQEIELTLSYGRHTTGRTARMYILELIPYTELELSMTSAQLGAANFFNPPPNFAGVLFDMQINTDLQGIGTSTGQHQIDIVLNGQSFTSVINVVDTTPPTATITNQTTAMGEVVSIDQFVSDVHDYSPSVIVRFRNEETPDFFTAGVQNVYIELEDYYGNIATYIATLTVLPNYDPPVLLGVDFFEFVVDGPIRFEGVSAADTFGRELDFIVDRESIDISTPGVYIVTFRTEDAQGLYAEETARVYVLSMDPRDILAHGISILEDILHEEMDSEEVSEAIAAWLEENVEYSEGFEHFHLYESVYHVLAHGVGNEEMVEAASELLHTLAR